jgi:Fic family protein
MSTLSTGRALTVYLLRDLHRDLMRGVRGEQKRPGEFRDAQVWIGAVGGNSPEVRFVPPPSLQLAQCLEGLDGYLASRGSFEGLLRIALAHYQFEAIHPFFDGNGRIGRLLLTMQMVWEGVLDSACLFLSPALERKRQDYYDRLLAVSRDGDFAGWIAFFLDIVRESAIETLDRLRRLRALQEEFTRRLRAVQSPKPALLVPELFGLPFVNVPRAQRLLGCMPKTAQGAIEKLVALGILQKVEPLRREGRGRPSHLYRCGEVLEIVRE